MFVTTKTRNPLHTNDDSDNDLLTLAKLMIISQLSSQQLIQIIENNQLKSLWVMEEILLEFLSLFVIKKIHVIIVTN